MTVENMHFDFKMKLNKVDSAKNRNFRPEEIDWLLNEAMDIFIKQRYHSKSFDDFATGSFLNSSVIFSNSDFKTETP